MLSKNYTMATTFVRPLLGLPNAMYTENYVNCFIKTGNMTKIYLQFRAKDDSQLTDQQKSTFEMLDNHPMFDGVNTNNGITTYTFLADNELTYDINRFAEGKFSKMSTSAKEMILFSQYNKDNVPVLSKILWPSDEDRKKLSEDLGDEIAADAEILSRPDLTVEVYKNE